MQIYRIISQNCKKMYSPNIVTYYSFMTFKYIQKDPSKKLISGVFWLWTKMTFVKELVINSIGLITLTCLAIYKMAFSVFHVYIKKAYNKKIMSNHPQPRSSVELFRITQQTSI